MIEASHQQVLDSVKELLQSGKYSDLIVACGSDKYNVHKAIVCGRSDFFAKAVAFPVGKEAQDGKIDVPEDEPAIVKLLMQYFYEGEYAPVLIPQLVDNTSVASPASTKYKKGRKLARDLPICSPPPDPVNKSAEQLLTHSKLYEIGDMYHVIGLKDLAKKKFERACQHFWDEPQFPIAANHAFSTAPEDDKGLRDVVARTISQHVVLAKKPEIKALMMEFNGLAYGLFMEKAAEFGWF